MVMKSISQHSVTFKVHKKSTEIEIIGGRTVPSKTGIKPRGKITEFSYKSARRFRMTLEDNADLAEWFTVLTYPKEFPADGRKVKRDIDVMARRLRRKGCVKGIWGMEFQKRGAPHVNLITKYEIDKAWLSQAWYEVVGSGDPKHLKAGTGTAKVRSKDEAITYMLGYMGKRDQKDVPEEYQNVGRFWGYWGDLVTESTGTYTYRFESSDALESFLQPVVKEYESNMKEWAKDKEKPYTWRYKGKSFVMWSGSKFINQFIEGECKNEREKASTERDRQRGIRGRNHRLTFCIQQSNKSVFRQELLGSP